MCLPSFRYLFAVLAITNAVMVLVLLLAALLLGGLSTFAIVTAFVLNSVIWAGVLVSRGSG
jgi:hypothetical protein